MCWSQNWISSNRLDKITFWNYVPYGHSVQMAAPFVWLTQVTRSEAENDKHTNKDKVWYSNGQKTAIGLWWRHQMETFSALLAPGAGNSPVSGEFPAQRPVTRSFDVFFDLHLNKRWNKQSWGWWFETILSPFWRHCYVIHTMMSFTLPWSVLISKWLTIHNLRILWDTIYCNLTWKHV